MVDYSDVKGDMHFTCSACGMRFDRGSPQERGGKGTVCRDCRHQYPDSLLDATGAPDGREWALGINDRFSLRFTRATITGQYVRLENDSGEPVAAGTRKRSKFSYAFVYDCGDGVDIRVDQIKWCALIR